MKKHLPLHNSVSHDEPGLYASGGAVRQGAQSRFYKNARDAFGRFLGSEDRFTGRKPAAPARTDEDWTKPVGARQGNSKSQKPVLPRS